MTTTLQDIFSDPTTFQRSTVLLGAGASSFAGAPSTDELTKQIRETEFPKAAVSGGPQYFFGSTTGDNGDPTDIPAPAFNVPIAKLMNEALGDLRFGIFSQSPDFESILHLTEELLSYSAPRSRMQVIARLRPVLESLTQPVDRWRVLFDAYTLIIAKQQYTNTIVRAIDAVSLSEKGRPLHELIDELGKRGRVECFTLNYDTLADTIFASLFGTSWTDGFKPFNDKYSVFDTSLFGDASAFSFSSTKKHRLCHMHGSVLFGYSTSPSDAALASAPLEIVKFSSSGDAQGTYGEEITRFSVSPTHEYNQAGPIISGLRKTEKMISMPYAYYFKAFIDALLSTSCVLIAGYGGRDPHINFWLTEMARRKPVRIIEIAKRSGWGGLFGVPGPAATPSNCVATDVLGFSNKSDQWQRVGEDEDLWQQENCLVYLGGFDPSKSLPLSEILEFSQLRGAPK